MAMGAIGYLAIGIDSQTPSTSAHSSAIIEGVPFISENLQAFRDDIVDPGISGSFDEDAMFDGLQRVEGNITALVTPVNLGYFLRAALDVTTSYPASGTITGATSAAAIREHRFLTGTDQWQTGSGTDLPSLTMEIFRGPAGTNTSFVYYNLAASTLEMTIDAGNHLRVSADLIGRAYGRKQKLSAVSYEVAVSVPWHTCSVQLGSTVAGLAGTPIFESLTFRIENNLQGIARLTAGKTFDLVKRNDFRRIAVNGTVGFANDAEYDRFTAGSELALRASFRPTTGSWMVVMDFPRVRYLTYPAVVGGPQRVVTGFTGKALYTTSGYTLQVFLVNTRTNNYTANTPS